MRALAIRGGGRHHHAHATRSDARRDAVDASWQPPPVNGSPAHDITISLDGSVDLAGHVNIAPGKPCAQSSLSRYSHPDGAAALVDPMVQQDFAIHTDLEQNPWWSIDLGAGYRDLILRITNRTARAAPASVTIRRRALPLVVQISEDGSRWSSVVDITQEFGALAIRLRSAAEQPAIRHLRIFVRQGRTALHLRRVEVFAPPGAVGEPTPPPTVDTDLVRAFHDRMVPSVDFDAARLNFERDRLSFCPDTQFLAIDAAYALRAGRLGNRINGAMMAILFAQEHRIRRVHLDFEDLASEFRLPASIRFGEIEILTRKPEAGENRFVVMSRFFYGRYVPRAVERDHQRLATILRQAIRPILMAGLEDGTLDAGTVVIHIRSGDLFEVDGQGGHPGYVQPPLAYYIAALHHAAAQHPVERVIVVHEDRRNPCVDALEARLASTGIPCTMQSGTLREDTTTIFAARRLIAGHGTFIPALLAQSGRAEAVYFFRRVSQRRLFDMMSPRVFVAEDTAGAFTPTGTWANTAAQRQLMLDYSGANIAIRAAGGR